jgi:hypothetical protein
MKNISLVIQHLLGPEEPQIQEGQLCARPDVQY